MSISVAAIGTPQKGLGQAGARILTTALWLLFILSVTLVVIVPLGYVFDNAFRKDVRFGMSDTYTLVSIANVYFGPKYLLALKEALLLASLVTACAVIVGVALALIVARVAIPAKAAINILVLMPMFLSPFNGLIAWIGLASERTGFINLAIRWLCDAVGLPHPPPFNVMTYTGAVWVMFLFFTPYVYLFTVSNLERIDSSLEEAARASGAGLMRTLLQVTLPVCLPSILAAGLLVFILAAETYTIPGVIGTTAGFNVLPWQIYHDAMLPPIRQANASAAATMLLIATVLGILLQRRITRNAERYATVQGKGQRLTPIELGRWRIVALFLVGFYILMSTILPTCMLLLSSLQQYTAPSFSTDILTLRHYDTFLSMASTRNAFANTIVLSLVASIACMLIGSFISYSEVRSRKLAPRMLAIVCTLPIAVPGLVYGLGLQKVYLGTPVYGTLWVLMLAYIAKCIPYGIMVSRSAILQIHPDLEQCGRACGAGPIRVLTRITMPLVATSLASIVFFVMLLSIKELSATLLLYTQRSETLAVLTWSYLQAGEYQLAAAVAIIQTLLITVLVFAVRFLFNIRLESIGGKG